MTASAQELADLVQQEQTRQAVALEQQTIADAAGGAGAALTVAVTAALTGWVGAFGALSVTGAGAALASYLTGVRRDVTRATAGMGQRAPRVVEGALDEAAAMGALHAADFAAHAAGGRRRSPAVAAPEDAVDAARSLGVLVRNHLRLSHTLLGEREVRRTGWRGVLAGIGAARQAVATVGRVGAWAVHRAINDGAAQTIAALDAGGLWVAEPDACVACLAYSGRLADEDGRFPGGLSLDPRQARASAPLIEGPPRHPHCLIGSTRVAGPSAVVSGDVPMGHSLDPSLFSLGSGGDGCALAASTLAETVGHAGGGHFRASVTRNYVGDVITIRTASGKELTGTPNHPIATRFGWRSLSELQVGDHVITSSRPEWEVDAVHPDIDDIPPRIEDVAQAFSVPFGPVPCSPEDFHGDGAGSDVYVVRTNGLLWDDVQAAASQIVGELDLGARDVAAAVGLHESRTLDLLLKTVFLAATSLVSGSNEAGALFGACAAHADMHGRATAPDLNSGLLKAEANGAPADVEGFCQSLLAVAGDVTTDEVVSVDLHAFSGHVYNLETEEGWYIGNGIVTHNCRCRLTPWRPQWAPSRGLSLPDLLQQQAWRSAATGRARPTESRAARLRAARTLLTAPGVPAGVRRQARTAVAAGHF